jgi:serine/threonine protein kinase
VGIELVDSFLRLHSLGFCYSSLSFDSVHFDPSTGEISLSGSEYVVADGEGIGSVLGTPRFMAPEINCGHARPCAATDHYSMAVILFYLLMIHHPMDGRQEKEIACLDLPAMQRLYGYEPVFIFDPKQGTNRPVAGVHNNATLFWNLYPSYLRDIFIRAFTTGIDDPGSRVKESEWRNALTRMRDQIFYCHKCGSENFLTSDEETSAPVTYPPCWSCGEIPIPPMRLRLGSHSVVLNQDTLLYAHHLDANRRNDYTEIMAEMVPHPKRPDVWGLKNVSPQKWTTVSSTGTTAEVATGRSVSLVPGLRIRFGNVEGMVG